MSAALVWVGLTLLGAVLGDEIVGWSAPLQRALIRRAAAVLPRSHRGRYVEEWYAELDELPDAPITRLLWVFSLVLRRGVLARELGVPRSVVGFSGAVKRCTDIGGSLGALLLFGPSLVLLALLIKIIDGGPVLVRHRVVGRDGATFGMFRFNTFGWPVEQNQVEPGARPVLRHTTLGRHLARTSLNELPELFNVLRGEMSFVGPLPARPPEPGRANRAVRHERVAPGLTWLFSPGARHYTDEQRKVLEKAYIDRWSLKLDLLIMWKAFVSAFRKPGRPL